MIVLYTTGCPKCIILENKLDEKGIKYEKCTDVDEMLELGLMSAPALKVDDKLMNFAAANAWVNEQ